ncbi:MAG: ATP-binding cassette domain-containing protein [Bacteroidota bacterium]
MSYLLQIDDLGHQFGEIVALEAVDLSLATQSCLAIVGPNGAGKSTLFNCISGLYRPLRGTLSFRGQSLLGKSIEQIARLGIARTFQQPKLFASLSVLQHLQLAQAPYGPLRGTLPLLRQILADCGLSALQGQKPPSLSFGQQKSLSIARCLASHAQLILLDEPAAGLSEAEKTAFIHLIQDLRTKYQFSILLVEHQLTIVEALADEVLLLDQGKSLIQANWEAVKRSTEWQKYKG